MLDFEAGYVARDEVKEQLLTDLGRNAIITGSSGIGKTTLALMRANLIVHGEAVDDRESLNIQMIHSSRLGGGAAAIQELLTDVSHRYHKNVVIIDEFHTLSLPAAEAFLPVLEQNIPEFTHWIFTTTHPQKVPAAVRSRLKQIRLTPPSYEEIIKFPRFKDITRQQYAQHQGNIRSIINNELGGNGDGSQPIIWANYVESMLVALDGGRDLYREALAELSDKLTMYSKDQPDKALATAKKIARLTSAVIKTDDIVMRSIASVEVMNS